MPDEQTKYTIAARWDESFADSAIQLANQLNLQYVQGTVIMTFGQVAPPPMAGTPQEQAAQVETIGHVPIRTVARFSVPAEAFRDMAGVIASTLAAIGADIPQAPNVGGDAE